MPIAITMEDDFVVHEDAEDWQTYQVGDDGPWMAQMVNGDGEAIGADAVIENIVQIQHMTDEEFAEIVDVL
jgi:hypothetical protein